MRDQTTQLANGLRVVTVEQPHLHSAAVSLMVRCGSRHERDEQWGLTHLVEHMLFRGSRRYPNARQLAHTFERAGGCLEASTWRDHTHLSTTLHPSNLDDVLGALGDMVVAPQFEGLAVERAVVEEELQGDLDEAGEDTDLSNVSRAAIWRGHPMGRRITGSLDTLRAFNDDHVRHHHASHYVGRNAVLCVAGKVHHAQVVDLANRTFGDLPAGTPVQDGAAARFSPHSRLVTRERPGSQVGIQLTFEALPDGHPDFAALSLLSNILDDGMSSRLQHTLCEQRGLVYEVTSGLDCYADCGLYDIEMQVAPRRAATALAATFEVLKEVCEQGVTDEELDLARQRSVHALEFRNDAPNELSEAFASSALFNQSRTDASEIDRMRQVVPADVTRVARDVFQGGHVHATLMGPLHRANMKRVEKLIEAFACRGK